MYATDIDEARSATQPAGSGGEARHVSWLMPDWPRRQLIKCFQLQTTPGIKLYYYNLLYIKVLII
jgi:hypothetical protein